MDEYTEVFHSVGYRTAEDVENLKELSEKEMRRMGIHKTRKYNFTTNHLVFCCIIIFISPIAHMRRLKQALDCLYFPTEGTTNKLKLYCVCEIFCNVHVLLLLNFS